MDVKLSLSNSEYKELTDYCNLNDLLISSVVKKSYTSGFNIERYGLLNGSQNTIEVIKEVPVEIIKEVIKEVVVEKQVEVIKEVPVEKVVEIIREVPSPPVEVKVIEYVDREVSTPPVEVKVIEYVDREVSTPPVEVKVIEYVDREVVKEVIVEKIVGDENKQKLLEQTLHNLRSDLINKDKKIKELEEIIQSFEKYKQNVGAVFLRGSNLDETLFK